MQSVLAKCIVTAARASRPLHFVTAGQGTAASRPEAQIAIDSPTIPLPSRKAKSNVGVRYRCVVEYNQVVFSSIRIAVYTPAPLRASREQRRSDVHRHLLSARVRVIPDPRRPNFTVFRLRPVHFPMPSSPRPLLHDGHHRASAHTPPQQFTNS